MPVGPGKYDDLCTYVREKANAQGAIVVIINGDRGAGFAVQADLQTTLTLADMLEHMAKQIRESIAQGKL